MTKSFTSPFSSPSLSSLQNTCFVIIRRIWLLSVLYHSTVLSIFHLWSLNLITTSAGLCSHNLIMHRKKLRLRKRLSMWFKVTQPGFKYYYYVMPNSVLFWFHHTVFMDRTWYADWWEWNGKIVRVGKYEI